jgi:hypothetical protein
MVRVADAGEPSGSARISTFHAALLLSVSLNITLRRYGKLARTVKQRQFSSRWLPVHQSLQRAVRRALKSPMPKTEADELPKGDYRRRLDRT